MKNIVAGVDFTERSRKALEEALRLASRSSGMVHAVHVVDRTAVEDLHLAPNHRAEAREGREGQLLLDTKRLMETHIEEGSFDRSGVTVEAIVGRPGDAIVEYAKTLGAEVIVMARNGASDPKSGAGSTALYVVRYASCDVLMVRQEHTGAFRRIVACVDFSEHSRAAMEGAAFFAVSAHEGAPELHLVHAYQPYWDVIHMGAISMNATGELQREHRVQLERRLEDLTQVMSKAADGIEVKQHIIPAGSAGAALVEFLEEIEADLAVVASHGRTGLARILLGSTAERIIREAPCSVLTTRRPSGA